MGFGRAEPWMHRGVLDGQDAEAMPMERVDARCCACRRKEEARRGKGEGGGAGVETGEATTKREERAGVLVEEVEVDGAEEEEKPKREVDVE